MLRDWRLIASLCLVALGQSCSADDFFEGMKPGLIGVYRDATREYSRVDADIAFDWSSSAPVPQLAPEGFAAHWSGVLLARGGSEFQLHAHLQGDVTVTLNGETVLQGATAAPAWVHGPVRSLEFGFLPLEVTFHKTGSVASIKLYWSSDGFPLEPLPAHQLFHEGDDSSQRMIEHGRVLFDAHRCSRCHQRGDVPVAPEGPPLIAVAADINPDWLNQKLLFTHAGKEHDKMPSFGFNEDEANAVAAWLWQINAPPRITAMREPNGETELPVGLTLVRSVGCLACHTLQGLGQSGPYGGGDLTHIGAKRTVEWIYTWLGQPERMDPNHRMPLVKLTPTERAQIARALSAIAYSDELSFHRPAQADNTRHVDHGEELMKRARCFNCHKVPAYEIDLRGLPQLDRPVQDWSRSCLAEGPDPATGRPAYPQADREALRAYVTFLTNSPVQIVPPPLERVEESAMDGATLAPVSTLSNFDFGRLTLERRNCLACHERDGATGIVPVAGLAAEQDANLRGLSESLIPPSLTAVGDKYREALLVEAVSGEVKSPRMPWLQVRMPKYRHTDEERAALAGFLIAHDRIPAAESLPDRAEDADDDVEPQPADDQTLAHGQQLVGAGGYSCISCHAVGDYEPRNTALATRGSDLKGMPARLRAEFFQRWCRSPLRVTPGVEMPSYEKIIAGVPGDSVAAQMEILWRAMGDPRFEAPTDPAPIEELRSLQPGDPPEIIRDVCRVSEANGGGFVARSFVMGFDNGHSILFDLDHACVRDWTFGDFARQRAAGKSWYWELAGEPLVSGLEPECEFVLKRGEEWTRLEPPVNHHGHGLSEFHSVNPSTGLTYTVPYPGGDAALAIQIGESWMARSSPLGVHEHRLTRQLHAHPLNSTTQAEESIWFVPSPVSPLQLNARIETDGEWTECGEFGRGVRIDIGAEVHYAADDAARVGALPPAARLPVQPEPVTTVPGFVGERLPVDPTTMPTSIAVSHNGTLAVTSLRGDLLRIDDGDGDGIPEAVAPLVTGLAAPFGVLPDFSRVSETQGGTRPLSDVSPFRRATWLVLHKPELLKLADFDSDGQLDRIAVEATGWGYTDDYHDWSTGPVSDAQGNLYIATSSDYANPERPEGQSLWRGKVLRIDLRGHITPIAHELRYPIGIAIDPHGRLFVSDQQGVANCYNEINHIVAGARYGVKGLTDSDTDQPEQRAAVQLPHPFTRSVNGIFFIPQGVDSLAPFAGHGIGCEYNGRFLIRFSLQEVGGELQGAMYLFSQNSWENDAENFLGPMCGAVAPNGDLYIGSMQDSGWLGGANTGEIVRLHRRGEFPNGMRELRATPDGFEIEFLHPVDPAAASEPDNYAITGATRVWQGSYSTEDSGQHAPAILSATLSADARTLRLQVERLESSCVYEVNVRGTVTTDGQPLFPATGYYTMNRVPAD